jgi:hypothetical protein
MSATGWTGRVRVPRPGGPGRRRWAWWLAAAAGVSAVGGATAQAVDGTLVVRSVDGESQIAVPPGGFFEVEISLSAGPATMFNAVLARLVFTTPGLVVHDYEWEKPFETDGFTDFSLVGLDLPVAVVPETLEGPGYPIDTSDVEFGNFLLSGMTEAGPLVRVLVQVPKSMPLGTEFLVAGVPDLVSNGFIPLSIGFGGQLTVVVQTPRPGDLNGDGVVNGVDLGILLFAWGGCNPKSPCPADLNGDGVVNGVDLGILLFDWG